MLGPRGGTTWMDVDHADVALVAIETGPSSCDASYLGWPLRSAPTS